MQPLTGPFVYGVNRRSESFVLLSDLLFAWYQKPEIRIVFGCVFNFMIRLELGLIICDRNALKYSYKQF